MAEHKIRRTARTTSVKSHTTRSSNVTRNRAPPKNSRNLTNHTSGRRDHRDHHHTSPLQVTQNDRRPRSLPLGPGHRPAPRLPDHPRPAVVSLSLPRGTPVQLALQPQDQVLCFPLLGLHGRWVRRAFWNCRLANLPPPLLGNQILDRMGEMKS